MREEFVFAFGMIGITFLAYILAFIHPYVNSLFVKPKRDSLGVEIIMRHKFHKKRILNLHLILLGGMIIWLIIAQFISSITWIMFLPYAVFYCFVIFYTMIGIVQYVYKGMLEENEKLERRKAQYR